MPANTAIVYWPAYMVSSYFGPYTPGPAMFAVRSSRAGTQSFLSEIERAVWSVNADLPVASPRTMQDIYSKSMARTSFTLVMLGIAAAMAFALGIIDIYGVISYTGIAAYVRNRHSHGARELRWVFVRSALALTGVGVVIGMGAAAAVARLLSTLLLGVSSFDQLSFAVPFILVVAAAVASFLPACCVAAVNPVDARRAE